MITETSRQAFEEFKNEGQLGERQQQVLQAYKTYGNHTNLEISFLTGIPINVITPRRNELREAGYVDFKGTRKSIIGDKIIGKNGEVYGLTEHYKNTILIKQKEIEVSKLVEPPKVVPSILPKPEFIYDPSMFPPQF